MVLDIGPRPAWVRVDPERVQQVLWNLASNAVKFTPPGSRVAVRRVVLDGIRWLPTARCKQHAHARRPRAGDLACLRCPAPGQREDAPAALPIERALPRPYVPLMKLVIAGGTGQVGALYRRRALARGDDVIILTRRPREDGDIAWDGRTLGAWQKAIDDADVDVVINLAGRTVNCRYTRKNLAEMMDSRVDSTRVIGQAIVAARRPPRVWLQMSTATIYARA